MLSMDVVPASKFEFFYIVCVSRSRIGLDGNYVHVETNTSLRRTWEQCTLGYVHGRRMRRSYKTSITSGHHRFT